MNQQARRSLFIYVEPDVARKVGLGIQRVCASYEWKKSRWNLWLAGGGVPSHDFLGRRRKIDPWVHQMVNEGFGYKLFADNSHLSVSRSATKSDLDVLHRLAGIEVPAKSTLIGSLSVEWSPDEDSRTQMSLAVHHGSPVPVAELSDAREVIPHLENFSFPEVDLAPMALHL